LAQCLYANGLRLNRITAFATEYPYLHTATDAAQLIIQASKRQR
jgi:hypothetical protein